MLIISLLLDHCTLSTNCVYCIIVSLHYCLSLTHHTTHYMTSFLSVSTLCEQCNHVPLNSQTGMDGRISRASVFCFGRLEYSDLVGLNADRVTLMTLKLIFVASWTDARYYWDRARTGWLRVRIMRLSVISGHDAGSLVFQWGSTIK